VNIGAIRNLFEKIITLSPQNRKLVNEWGLHVDDQITIEFIAWGVFKINKHYSGKDIATTLTVDDFRSFLFSPVLVSQLRLTDIDKPPKRNSL
jgi:hypothetical protein